MLDFLEIHELRKQLREAQIANASIFTAIMAVLADKGITTKEEMERYISQSTSAVDQYAAALADESKT